MFKKLIFMVSVSVISLSAMDSGNSNNPRESLDGKMQQLSWDAANNALNVFIRKRVQADYDRVWPRFVTQAKEFCATNNMPGLDALFDLVIDTDFEEKRMLFNLEGIKHTDPGHGLLLLARFFKHRELGKKTHNILSVLQECREIVDPEPGKHVATEDIMRLAKDIIRMYGCGKLQQQTDGSVQYTCLRNATTCLKSSNLCHVCDSTILDYISDDVVRECCSKSIEFGSACTPCAALLKNHLHRDLIILKIAAQALGAQDKK